MVGPLNPSRLPQVLLAIAMLASAGPAVAQSTDQQIEQMEKQLDMNATPDAGALGFQDDLAKIEQCQTACKPLLESMLKKYKTGANYGGNAALGASDIQQLAAALGSAAATLSKADAADIGKAVAADLGADAATAYQGSYNATTAPFNPQ